MENIDNYVYVNGEKQFKNNTHDFKVGVIDKDMLTFDEQTELVLCKETNEEVFILQEAYEIEIVPRFQETYELNFKIPEYIPVQHTFEKNPMYSYIEEGLLVKFNNEIMFKITSVDIVEKNTNYKQVQCFSREHELTKVFLRNFHGTRQLYVDGSETLVKYCEYSFDDENYERYTVPVKMKEKQKLFIKLYDHEGGLIHKYEWDSTLQLPDYEGIVVTYRFVDTFTKDIEVDIRLVSETGEGILNMLEEETGWRVNYLDPMVREDFSTGQFHRKYRTFSVDERNWLEYLRDEVCKSFQGIIIFNTIPRTIDMYHIDNWTKDKGLFISKENYAKHIEKKIDGDEAVTVLYCYGEEGLNIADINPIGQEWIFDFSYYKKPKFMSKELIKALNDYEELIENRTPLFYEYLQQIDKYNRTLINLENDLVNLEVQWDLAQDIIDLEIQNYKYSTKPPILVENTGDMGVEVKDEIDIDTTDAEVPKDLIPFNQRRDEVEAEIQKQNTEIGKCKVMLEEYYKRVGMLRTELSLKNNFTPVLLRELSGFKKVKTFSDETLFTSKDVLEEGKKQLKKLTNPQISFSMDMVDIFNVVECQHDWHKLQLGDKIHLYMGSLEEEVIVRVVEINHQLDKGQLSIIVSNKDYLDTDAKMIVDMMTNANNVSNAFDKYRPQFHTVDKTADLVTQMFQSEINTAYNRLVSARNQNIRIDERGILLKDMFEHNEQLRIVNNVIAFTQDGWDSVSLAITPRGLTAETIIGKLVASNKLLITNRNSSGMSSFVVDENHMKAVNMDLSLETGSRTNRIFLNPAIGIRLQKRPTVGHPWEDMLYLNINDGSGWAKSWNIINTNTRLDDKGLRIDNGAIWINNEEGDDVFQVNNKGEVDAMGRFRIFRKSGQETIVLGDYYKDEGKGGKIQLNDWNGTINAFLGSAPSTDYSGGFLKLYNEEDKERIEIGTQTEGDTGIVKIKNYEQKELISLTGNNLGATIKLNNKEEKTKLFMSSQDEELNQGIVKLYGEDDKMKLMLKAKSSTDNMSDIDPSDRKTGGLIQLNSYDNSHKFFITANNENNFGMYDMNGSAFEINTSTDAVICNHKRLSSFSLAKGGISINVTDLNNLRVALFKDKIEGLPIKTYRLPAMTVVNSHFSGSGKPTVIKHDFGDLNYGVSLSPIGQPDPSIGQYSFTLQENTVSIHNTGKGTSSFQCILFR